MKHSIALARAIKWHEKDSLPYPWVQRPDAPSGIDMAAQRWRWSRYCRIFWCSHPCNWSGDEDVYNKPERHGEAITQIAFQHAGACPCAAGICSMFFYCWCDPEGQKVAEIIFTKETGRFECRGSAWMTDSAHTPKP